MGNCSCLRGNHDEKQIDTSRQAAENGICKLAALDSLTPSGQINCHRPNLVLIDLLRLQALMRGYLERKRTRALYNHNNFNSPPDPKDFIGKLACHKSITRDSLKELPSNLTPDYLSPSTKAIRSRLGEFSFSPSKASENLTSKGAVVIENESIYTGEWNSLNQRHGRGTQIWRDGSIYEGHWDCDKANGQGRMIHSNGDVYEGEWVNDKAHGYGVYKHSDGARYEGYWENDKQHGKGCEVWPDSAKYEGFYENGQKSGIGKFEWAEGSVYQGMFKGNNIHGIGTYVWNDGRVYVGEWRDNKMDGKGIFTWSDGRRYEGEYVEDKKQGVGVFVWPDGRKYEGSWVNGKQEGKGIYTTSVGARAGEWKDGKRVKVY